MNTDDKDNEINELKERISCLEAELHETKVHLKKYTAPDSRKEYYEKNKQQILEKKKLNPTPQEKRQEYNRTSYLRRKAKLEMEQKQDGEEV